MNMGNRSKAFTLFWMLKIGAIALIENVKGLLDYF